MRKRRVASTRWAIRICSLELSAPHHRPTARQRLTWSIVSGFKGLENDVVILAGLTDIDDDWYRGVAYVGMSRARTRLHVIETQQFAADRLETSSAIRAASIPISRSIPVGDT